MMNLSVFSGHLQSDVVHQSVYELVHSEDREELQRQLTWNSQLPPDSGLGLMDALRPDNAMILERSFTVRFRCLLDNTSGFLVIIVFSSGFLRTSQSNAAVARTSDRVDLTDPRKKMNGHNMDRTKLYFCPFHF